MIEEGVTSISEGAFKGLSELTSVVIPDSVTSIGSSAFEGCSSLSSVTMGNSVTSIGSKAFNGCNNLVYNTYGDAKYLGNTANSHHALIEANSTGITSCEINENTKVIADEAFKGCSELTSVAIPDSVISIGDATFSNCSALTSVTIPGTVTSIGNLAFNSCSELKSVNFYGQKQPIYGNNLFEGCNNLNEINVPADYEGETFCGKPVLKWHSITYDLNGGTVSSENPTQYDIKTADITLTNPTKVGYEFTGWTENGLTMPTKSVTIPSGSTENKNYTANWTPINYNITFDLQGGSVALANPTTYNIETEDFTLINPTKEGYKFTGWTGTGLIKKTDSVIIPKGSTEDRSYTAYWEIINYDITFDLQGGSIASINPTKYNVETEDFTLSNPTKIGYDFAGWSGSNGNDPQTSVTIQKGSTENRSYTANWTPINYNITFDLQGGTVTLANPTQYTIETDTITLSNPTKVGYEFTGWTGSNLNEETKTVIISTGSTGDREYIANWKKEDSQIEVSTTPKKSNLSSGAITGIVVSVVGGVVAAIFGRLFCLKHQQSDATDPTAPGDPVTSF